MTEGMPLASGWIALLGETAAKTFVDILPILGALLFFQLVVLRQRVPNPQRMAVGFLCVVAGLTLFLVGLEKALFPLGRMMAEQLTAPSFLGVIPVAGDIHWRDYLWVYGFAACVGFATTIAEPSLIAVGLKAQEISGGAINATGLRIAVAIGVAIGVCLGTFRIVAGFPLPWLIVIGYVVVTIQTALAPKAIIPLAYDSGGVTTSTVTVPLVTALGLGLATSIPGRTAMIDGFGLIALASLFPMITVMGYAEIGAFLERRARMRDRDKAALGEENHQE